MLQFYLHQKVHFTLKKASIDVTLTTIPINGKIYLDDKELGNGQWQGSLAPGKYNIRFGSVNSYNSPKPTTIEIDERKKTKFTFKYIPNFSLTFSPLGLLPKTASGNIQTGYFSFFNSDFN